MTAFQKMLTTPHLFLAAASAPRDTALLALVRVTLGVVLAGRCAQLLMGHVSFFDTSALLFHYWGWGWLPRPPQGAVELMMGVGLLGGLALIRGGAVARWSAPVAFLCFGYFFMSDKAYFGNLNYFLVWSLLALLLSGAWRAARHVPHAEAWRLWPQRWLLVALYFYAGLVKLLSPDWLAGDVLQIFMRGAGLPALLTESRPLLLGMAWSGAAFDLWIGPLLLWPRTRRLALIAAALFHMTNMIIVDIQVIPLAMLTVTLGAFASPSLARRLLRWPPDEPEAASVEPDHGGVVRAAPRARLALVALFLAFHMIFPLRPYFHESDSRWTHHTQHLSWWLRSTSIEVNAKFFVEADGERRKVDVPAYIAPDQNLFASNPFMIVQFAHHLAAEARASGASQVAVFADITASLNGRPTQRFIPETLDLAREPLRYDMSHLVVPLEPREP